jgi:hypothetical protein
MLAEKFKIIQKTSSKGENNNKSLLPNLLQQLFNNRNCIRNRIPATIIITVKAVPVKIKINPVT